MAPTKDALMSKIDTLADEAYQEHLELLALARSKATDGVYREGSPEYENLIEAYTIMGIATGLRFAATVPILEGQDDSGDDS